MFKYGIIGAGPAGLSASLFLGNDSEVLEASESVGGVAGSFFDSGYTFDYGPHIIFSKNKSVLDFMVRLLGDNIHKCKRNNKVSFEGKLVKYPFENDLSSISPTARYDCIKGYFLNQYKNIYKNPVNLKQWLLYHFGEGICHHYLFPYNEKVWNIPVDQLSMIWADRIPKPPVDDIIKSISGVETEGYTHQLYYYYPLSGGYKAISNELSKRCNITYNFKVNYIEWCGNYFKVYSNDGQVRQYESLVSTMPIHELIKVTNLKIPKEITEAVSSLIVNPMAIISLGLKGLDTNKYTALYFPEADFLVNRVSFPSTFSPKNNPTNTFSLQAEITYSKGSKTSLLSDAQLLDHVILGLTNRGIIDKNNVIYSRVDRLEYAYVVYDRNYEQNVQVVRDWFWDKKLYLNGRFSYFEYLNVDGIIELSKNIVEKITCKRVDYQNYLDT